MTEVGDYIFFYGTDWPSNFTPAKIKAKDMMYHASLFDEPIETDGLRVRMPQCITYNDSETYYQSWKAYVMGDEKNYYRIAAASTPADAKKLSWNVNLNKELWDKCKDVIMYDVLRQKFTQNPDLMKLLLDEKYDNKIFIEASPTDLYWGIGFSETMVKNFIDRNGFNPMDDPRIKKGKNMLGKLLNDLRNSLILARKK